MTIKEFLNQAFILEKRIKDKKEELEKIIIDSVAIMSPRFDNEIRVNNYNDKIGDITCKKIELVNMIFEQSEHLLKLKYEIINLIESIENQEYRRLLELRYIQYLKWEEIALKMDYSYRHTTKLHSFALKECEKIKDAPKCPTKMCYSI